MESNPLHWCSAAGGRDRGRPGLLGLGRSPLKRQLPSSNAADRSAGAARDIKPGLFPARAQRHAPRTLACSKAEGECSHAGASAGEVAVKSAGFCAQILLAPAARSAAASLAAAAAAATGPPWPVFWGDPCPCWRALEEGRRKDRSLIFWQRAAAAWPPARSPLLEAAKLARGLATFTREVGRPSGSIGAHRWGDLSLSRAPAQRARAGAKAPALKRAGGRPHPLGPAAGAARRLVGRHTRRCAAPPRST